MYHSSPENRTEWELISWTSLASDFEHVEILKNFNFIFLQTNTFLSTNMLLSILSNLYSSQPINSGNRIAEYIPDHAEEVVVIQELTDGLKREVIWDVSPALGDKINASYPFVFFFKLMARKMWHYMSQKLINFKIQNYKKQKRQSHQTWLIL